jgi:YegS/Rv2252/BmrU family lipid kinase
VPLQRGAVASASPAISIIINPVAGGARGDRARQRVEIAAAWRDDAGRPAEVVVTERAGHAGELARAAARQAGLVIAWGGDGTINEVASALAFGNVPMAIVPAGSGNGLATELEIDNRPRQAIDEAVRSRPRPIDLGEIAGRLFVNIAGLGFDAHVAEKFNAPENVKRGLATYASITGRALFRYRPADYAITTPDGCVRARRAVMVSFANSAQFGNGARIAPGAAVDDGLLDLVVLEERSRLASILALPRLFNGTIGRHPGYTLRRVTEATITSAEPILFHADGEPIQGGTELKIRVHPRALLLAVR